MVHVGPKDVMLGNADVPIARRIYPMPKEGTSCLPLQGHDNHHYATDAPAAGPHSRVGDLTPEEREAESLFRDAMHRRVAFAEARIRAAEIEGRSPIAGQYLRWLLQRHRSSLCRCSTDL